MRKKRRKLKAVITAFARFRGIDLVSIREEAGLSQQELAERIDFWSQQRISTIESSPANVVHTLSLRQYKELNRALN